MKLGKKELFAFGFLSVPLSMGGLPLGLYLTPYYASFGISLSVIGIVLMLTPVTDVITDPLTRERHGELREALARHDLAAQSP